MILWLPRDAFYAGLLGVVVILAFVGYNTMRTIRRRYKVVRRDDAQSPPKWN